MGPQIANRVWILVRRHIPVEKREEIARKIYDIFCEEDADDWSGLEITKLAAPEEYGKEDE